MADKNNKKRSGLHKEISSIFDGVPVPSDRPADRPHTRPEQGRAGYDSPRSSAKPPQNSRIPGSYRQPVQPGRVPGVAPAKSGEAVSAVGRGPLQRIAAKVFAPRPGVSSARRKATVLLVPVLAVVLVVVLAKSLGISSLEAKEPVIPKPTTPVAAVPTGITWQKPEPYPTGLRDPMQLTAEMTTQIGPKADTGVQAKADTLTQRQIDTGTIGPQTTAVGELTVKGILFSDDNPSAVVGTRIGHVGDIIAGATIVKINRKSVDFEKDGETWTQTVEP